MKKVLDLMRKFTTVIGITGDGVHTFYSLLLGIFFFYFGIWFEASHSVWAGFFAAIVIPPIIGVVLEIAQAKFGFGQAAWGDVLADIYGTGIAVVLLTLLHLVFL